MMRKAGYVERSPNAPERALDESRQWLRRGTAVLLFAEGESGEWRALAQELGVPVIDLTFEGALPITAGGGWLNPSGDVRVVVQLSQGSRVP
jgi:hypothetical protein